MRHPGEGEMPFYYRLEVKLWGFSDILTLHPLSFRYRAVILEETAADCKVRFIDYGNTSRVTKDKLKLLTTEHLELPSNCLNVRLGKFQS